MMSKMRQALRRVTSTRTRRRLAFAVVSARQPTARWRPLPNLLLVGSQRCGTSSLFKYLGAHPQCSASIRKEIRFFTEFHDRGVGWYRSHFPFVARGNSGSHHVFFEATPDYLLDPRVPRRATELMPDVKIVVLLRDPIKRAYSHYWHNRRLGTEPLSFEDALRREPERIGPWLESLDENPDQPASRSFLRYSYVERGRYAKHLQRWIDVIDDPARILVLRSEDLFRDTDATFQEILRFLDLPEWRPTTYRNFSYQGTRPVYPPMPEECREWLAERFADDAARLRQILESRATFIGEGSHSKRETASASVHVSPRLPIQNGDGSPPTYSREIELLLCCRGRNGEATAHRMSRLLDEGIDWPRLLDLARWHKLVPLLFLSLDRLDSSAIPPEVSQLLGRVFRFNAGRSLAMTGELLSILDALEARGIDAIPYKGPVMAERLYGNMALRQSSDLDLVVDRHDVAVAREVLLERGYRSSIELHGANRKFLLQSRYSERFDRPEGMAVELHWAFTNKDVAFPLTLGDLRPRLEEIQLGGRRVAVSSREDMLLVLCVHGAKHLWNRLEWILGVAELAGNEIDWDLVRSRARETRSERMLLLGLVLANDLYGASCPEEIMREARSNRAVRELAGEVKRDLSTEEFRWERDESNNLKYDVFHYRLGDDLSSRFRYAFYRVTTPSHPEHWASVSIGDHWVALHGFIRPFVLMSKMASLLQSKVFGAFRKKPDPAVR